MKYRAKYYMISFYPDMICIPGDSKVETNPIKSFINQTIFHSACSHYIHTFVHQFNNNEYVIECHGCSNFECQENGIKAPHTTMP